MDYDWDQVARWVWENKGWIHARLSELRRWLFPPAEEKKSGILIIGPGGVGKSTFAQTFSGRFNGLLDIPGAYQESIDLEHFALADDPAVELVVPPGQRHRRDATWSDVERTIGAGGYRGIVIASSYGYHSLGEISYKQHRLYHGDKAAFLADFLQESRADELSVLKRLAPHIRLNARKCWILTLVTKEDLWWADRADVDIHYRSGEYGKIVDEVVRHVGGDRLRHEFAFSSLVISNFTTGRDELLANTVAGYDQIRQVKSLRRLWETFDALKSWEERP